MIHNVSQVMQWLGLSEGGYVNNPNDPGGPTNRGVTERVWHAWLRYHGRAPSGVKNITKAHADEIFIDQYLMPVWFNRLPSGLDYAMADYAVNSGPGRAVKDMQRVLVELGHPMTVDGGMGIVTYSAIMQEPDAGLLVSALCNRRLAFMKRLKTWKHFGKGWTRRVMGEYDGAQDSDTGVIDRGVRMARNEPSKGKPKAAPGKATGEPMGGLAALIAVIVAVIQSIFKGTKQ